MPELILFIGLQATGKSTFFKSNFADSHQWISKDHFPNRKKREQHQRKLVEEALQAGQDVVVDNTNPRAEDREPLIAIGKQHNATIKGYYFASRPKESIVRNAQRTGKARVPDVAIYATIKKLQQPSYDEGFDELYYVKIAPSGQANEDVPVPLQFDITKWHS